MDKSIELKKMQNEKLEKKDARETEYDLKMAEMQHDRIDRIVKNTLTGLATAGGLGVAIWGTLMSLKFEEKGVVTTISGRSFIQSLLHPLKCLTRIGRASGQSWALCFHPRNIHVLLWKTYILRR